MLSTSLHTANHQPSGDTEQIYRSLCQILAGQPDHAIWSSFNAADWEHLAETARTHGVAPLLYHALRKAGLLSNVPRDTQVELRQAYYATAAQNTLIHQELSRILAALPVSPTCPIRVNLSALATVGRVAEGVSRPRERVLDRPLGLDTRLKPLLDRRSLLKLTHMPTCPERGRRALPLPVIVLKGAALATTVYPTIAARPLGDIDLLVQREHLDDVIETMRALGYRRAHPEMAPGLNRVVGYHVSLRGGPQQSVLVELHWGLGAGGAGRRSVSVDWFLEQTEPWTGRKRSREKGNPSTSSGRRKEIREDEEKGASGHRSTFQHSDFFPSQPIPFSTSVLQLTPTAHLLYLAAHLMHQHAGDRPRLLWLYDMHLLITRCTDRLNWDELARRASEFGWTAALYAALRGVQVRFATPLPAGLLASLEDTVNDESPRLEGHKGGALRTRAGSVLDNLAAVGWQTRLRLAWGIICPDPAWMRWRYKPQPAWLWPLYYPYRWLDILRDGLTTVWRIVRRS